MTTFLVILILIIVIFFIYLIGKIYDPLTYPCFITMCILGIITSVLLLDGTLAETIDGYIGYF